MELSRILNENEVRDSLASPVSDTESIREPSSPSEADIRVGKWTDQEEAYAMELVHQFSAGTLRVQTGISLRSLLARKLRCSPMRISTKLATEILNNNKLPKKLGQKRFFPVPLSDVERQQNMARLKSLERAFLAIENLEEEQDDTTVDEPVQANVSSAKEPKRVGSWSDEEQDFTLALIDGFMQGLLDIPEGTTLRSFLAQELCCNPMRISKKLATGTMGAHTLPKRLGSSSYHPPSHVDPGQKVAFALQLQSLRTACFPSQTMCTPVNRSVAVANSIAPCGKRKAIDNGNNPLPSVMTWSSFRKGYWEHHSRKLLRLE